MSIATTIKSWLTATGAQPGELLQTSATVEMQAAAEGDSNKPARVKILAYSGGEMKPPGWKPVVLELSGIELPSSVPLLVDHANKVDAISGQGKPSISGGKLIVDGELARETFAAKQIISLSKAGVTLGASVGIETLQRSSVEPGETVSVNGRTFTAGVDGLIVIRSSRLREVSFTPVGADSSAGVQSLAATGSNMTTTATNPTDLQAALAQERNRTKTQLDLLASCQFETVETNDFQNRIIAGMSDGDFQQELVATMRLENMNQSLPLSPRDQRVPAVHIKRSAFTPGQGKDVISAVLLCRSGHEAIAEKAYGERVLEAASPYRHSSLFDLAKYSLAVDGRDVPTERNDVLRASFAQSTNAMTSALAGGIDKLVGVRFTAAPKTWASFAAIKDLPNFREHKMISPEFAGQLEQVNNAGDIEHGFIKDGNIALKCETYAKLLGMSRHDVFADDLRIFDDVQSIFVKHALRKLNDLVWGVIIANANAHFDAGKANLIDHLLTIDGVSAAVAAMRSQRDSENNDLDIVPRVLAVSPTLEAVGRSIINSTEVGRDDGGPTGNPLKSIATLEVESRLSNTAKFPGANAAGWYLFGGPESAPVYVGFVDGKQTPTVEFFGYDSDPNRLGVSWRVYIDAGAALGEIRSAVRSSGDASE